MESAEKMNFPSHGMELQFDVEPSKSRVPFHFLNPVCFIKSDG